MKKLITSLCFVLGILLFTGQAFGQSAQHSGNKITTTMQNGVKIIVSSGTKSRVDFLNTSSEDLVFTWSITNKHGDVQFTSGIMQVKPGSTASYPNSTEISKADEAQLLDGVDASQIKISIKK
jgi:hypothetical protein